MNQSFKKKVIAASLATAFAFGASAVMANTFASSYIADPTKKTVNTTSPSAVTINDVVIQELGAAGMADGYITIKIPSTVKLNQTDGTAITRDTTTLGTAAAPKDLNLYIATTASTRASYVFIGTPTGESTAGGVEIFKAAVKADGTNPTNAYLVSGTTVTNIMELADWSTLGSAARSGAGVVKVGQIYLDASTSETVITLALKASTNIDSASVSAMSLTPATASTTGTVALQVLDGKADGSAKTGAGDDTSVPVITMANQSASLAGTAATATVPTVAAGGVAAQSTGIMTFTFVGAAAANDNVITVALDNGAKFHSAQGAVVGAAVTGTGSVATDLAASSGAGQNSAAVTVNSSGQLVITMGTSDAADGDTIVIPAGTLAIDASSTTAAGSITATATGSGTNLSGFSATAVVASASLKSAAGSFVDDTTTGFAKVYAGRTGQTIAEKLRIAEGAPGSLLSGGTITLATDKGKFTASDAITSTEYTTSPYANTSLAISSITAPSTAAASVSTSVTGVSTSAEGIGAYDIDSFSFNLTDATAGDLSITLGGTAGATGTVKMAEVIDATSASVSGALPNMVNGGGSVALPDIVITENKAAALAAARMSITLPAGVTYDTSAVPTITVKDAAGTALTGKVTTPAATHFVANAGGVANSTYNIEIAAASSTATGPYTITVSGLKASSSSTAVAGTASAKIHGNSNAVTAAPTAGDDSATSGSNVGAMPRLASVSIASVVSGSVPLIPAATATGTNTALTLSSSVVAAGNDQGKIGTLFVVAVLPNGQIYSRNSSGGWKLWDGSSAFDSVAAGVTLGSHSVDILSAAMDVSSLVGTQIYVGYGIGALGTSAYTNLLANATYNKVYTVQ